ncbi:hemolysin D [Niabella ginsenosidivorans]|uniref:Hemolysin D n=1 Tax=Niabella ginsenosidivorans TaxID=1176587 RepID=A0A1A9I4S2_9BACT|nr:HlyD family secretion protein [Niabella ginsenosidivorans]ANH82553.1 hemolysin D [Niabella ginsenosidivorans]
MPVAKEKSGKRTKIIYNIIYGLILTALIVWGLITYFHINDKVYTDDAQVEENVNPVNARISGYLKEIRFEEHQPVKKGDTLAVIDDAEYRIQLDKAVANLAAARAGKTVVQSDVDVAQAGTSISEANLAELKARLDNQEVNLKRYANLLKEDVVSQYQYDQVKTEYDAMKAKYQSLLSQYRSTQLTSTATSRKINVSEADIALAQAAIAQAKLNLSYCYIVAPYDGVMGRRKIATGQLISVGQILGTIVQSGEKWVTANYTESQISKIKQGQLLQLRIDALPGKRFEGRVTAISEATGSRYSAVPVDNSTGNFVKVQQRIPVRIEFTEKNNSADLALVKAGMNVEVDQ